MKIKICAFFVPFGMAFMLLWVTTVHAAPAYNSSANITQMTAILDGPGLSVGNLSVTRGVAQQYGIFNGGGDAFGVNTGVFLNTGNMGSIQGPNTSADYSSNTKVQYLDADLGKINTTAKYDPAILEFDITPAGDRVNFVFAFGSEEYPEYVCSRFNDVFGLFVSGPGLDGVRNAAFMPDTGEAIAVNNVNAGVRGSNADGSACQLGNAAYFVDNGNGSGSSLSQLDGYTRAMTASLPGLIAGQTYHIKLAIADAGDPAYDSGAFFKWLTSTNSTPVDLSLHVATSSLSPVWNNEVEISYTVKNASSIPTSLVQVDLEWPAGLVWVGDDSAGSYNATTGEWNADVIPANGSKTLKVRARVGTAASYRIDGEITFAFNVDPDSTPFNRRIYPNEDDTAVLTLFPVEKPINLPPVLTSNAGKATATVLAPEGQTVVTVISATDTSAVTYTISGGADAAKFTLNASSGVLTFMSAPDYESPTDSDKNNVYEVQVTASDGSLSTTQTLHVSVTDVVEIEPPVISNASAIGYSENATTLVMDINATHKTETEGKGLVFSFSGQVDDALFEINPVNGVVSFKQPPDYEQPLDANADNAYIVGIRVCDSHATCDDRVVIVSVQDVDEDTDKDGLLDSVEKVLGTDPKKADTDGDGISDKNELGGDLTTPLDHDKDGLIDALDDDDDNDGILTRYEIPDPNGDGNAADARDSDADGKPDYLDTDDDGDTVLTRYEIPDQNGDGNLGDARDTDKDGIPDYLDTDDDNDGSPTSTEKSDPNGDGNPSDAIDNNGNNIAAYLDADEDFLVTVQLRVILQGAYSSSTGLMSSALHQQSILPTLQPYGELKSAFGYVDSGGTVSPFKYYGKETIGAAVWGASGNAAPVDWLLIELRDKAAPATRVAAIAAVLQRDGNVVDAATGSKTLKLFDVLDGDYYVVVRHRNHLGVMTEAPVYLTTPPKMIDFSQPETKVYGGETARLQSKTVALLWSGDVNNSNSIIVSGPGSDTNVILGTILVSADNKLVNASFRLVGYYATDLNMDGVALYSGPNNDINILLGNVLVHPDNLTFSNNFIIKGSVPR